MTGAGPGAGGVPQVYRAPVADCLAAMETDVGRGGGGVSFGHPVPPRTQTSTASCYVTQLVGGRRGGGAAWCTHMALHRGLNCVASVGLKVQRWEWVTAPLPEAMGPEEGWAW